MLGVAPVAVLVVVDLDAHVGTPRAPWHVVIANDKKKARLNCLNHFIGLFDYFVVEREDVTLPERAHNEGYRRLEVPASMLVPEVY